VPSLLPEVRLLVVGLARHLLPVNTALLRNKALRVVTVLRLLLVSTALLRNKALRVGTALRLLLLVNTALRLLLVSTALLRVDNMELLPADNTAALLLPER